MAYDATEARRDLLDDVAEATDQIALALALVGEAYEQLDEHSADTLEEQLFRPLQGAYGRARRTHAEFAERRGLPGRTFAPATPGGAARGARALIDRAVDAIAQADGGLATLQDSMRPVEVGDPELRAGLAEVRHLLTPLPSRAHQLERMLGR